MGAVGITWTRSTRTLSIEAGLLPAALVAMTSTKTARPSFDSSIVQDVTEADAVVQVPTGHLDLKSKALAM